MSKSPKLSRRDNAGTHFLRLSGVYGIRYFLTRPYEKFKNWLYLRKAKEPTANVDEKFLKEDLIWSHSGSPEGAKYKLIQ